MIVPDGAFGARLSDVQMRFLRAVAERLPLERVAEVHLFPPIRQGLLESGVAVIAVFPEPAPALADAAVEEVDAGAPMPEVGENHELALDDEPLPEQSTMPGDPQTPARPFTGEFRIVDDAPAEPHATHEVSDDETVDAKPDASGDEQGEASDGERGDVVATVDATPSEPASPAPAAPDARRRLVIFGASYRITLKGPDRGKWEVDVRAEADAPLITVDAVVRGMQRRSPDAADPERLTGDALRAMLAPADPIAPFAG